MRHECTILLVTLLFQYILAEATSSTTFDSRRDFLKNSDGSNAGSLHLSKRGSLAIKPGRDDLEEFITGLSDPYHPISNKEGYLVLLVAENKLNINMLKQKLENICSQNIPSWVLGYGDMRGHADFRAAVSKMMEETFINSPVDKECIVAQASNPIFDDFLTHDVTFGFSGRMRGDHRHHGLVLGGGGRLVHRAWTALSRL